MRLVLKGNENQMLTDDLPPQPTSMTSMPRSGFDCFSNFALSLWAIMFFSMTERMYATRVGFIRSKGAAEPSGCHHFAACAANFAISDGSTEDGFSVFVEILRILRLKAERRD